MEKMIRQMNKRRDNVFFNAITAEVIMELVGILAGAWYSQR